ncbi:MAG: cation-transporting P-type ATPase [Nitrospirae bacterium]|nr:cation-transporting P-type ATPase [Nitrospirota bacterium]
MKKPWAAEIDSVIKEQGTDAVRGLAAAEAKERLKRFGPNKLIEERRLAFLDVFWAEIREPMIMLLLIVGLLYSVWGELRDAATIFIIITILVYAEVFNEYRAKRSIEMLKRLSSPTAGVIRDGRHQEILTTDIISGDILIIKSGERVPADARLIESYSIAADESVLTGESVPEEKEAAATLTDDAPVADRRNMLFAGTVVTRGRGKGIATATGMETEFGRVTGLVKAVKEPKTPLQLSMKQLSGWLVYLAVFFSVIIPLIGFIQGQPFKEMVLTGLGLAFATIPEELPIIITMVLGLGAYNLAKGNAVIKRLRAAETLGSVTVIATDKTGTITENRMMLSEIFVDGKKIDFESRGGVTPPLQNNTLKRLLEIGALANDAYEIKENNEISYIGDPIDVALLTAIKDKVLNPLSIKERYKFVTELPFDNTRKMMSVFYTCGNEGCVFAKGSPDAILSRSAKLLILGEERDLSEEDRNNILYAAADMAGRALRVIALGYRKVGANGRSPLQQDFEPNLTFVGLAGFLDPPRSEVKDAVRVTKDAGVRIVMITGDHELTAKRIGDDVGIETSRIVSGRELDAMDDESLREAVSRGERPFAPTPLFARITPEHKLRIVRALKENGEVVAVTGDGINDAPALKEADIGVAMGRAGTDVAKETADMILQDDDFTTITRAIREGRKLFDNLTKGVRYYLACKTALIAIFALPVIFNLPLPFAPIQIILLELFMDLAASVSFVAEIEEGDIMRRRPRDPKTKFMNRAMTLSIFSGAIGLFLAVSLGYLYALNTGMEPVKAQTIAFATWMLTHVFLAFNMRSEKEPLFRMGIFSNKAMVIWAGVSVIALVIGVNQPLIQQALKTTTLSINEWGAVVVLSIAGSFWKEGKKLYAIAQCKMKNAN